jgi:hypothetical protein
MKNTTKGMVLIGVLIATGVAIEFVKKSYEGIELERRVQTELRAAQEARSKAAAEEKRSKEEKERIERLRNALAPNRAEILRKADALLQSDPSKVRELLSEYRPLKDPEIESYLRAAETRAASWAAAQRHEITDAELRARKKEGVAIGMTTERVFQSSWGKPFRVNRTTTATRNIEQWVYGNGRYLYFEDGVLTAIQE